MNLVAVSFESNRIYLSCPGAHSMYSDYLAPTSASLSYAKYFQYTCIRLCHLCMFDRAYYRSSILSMSLCIVSIKKTQRTRLHIYTTGSFWLVFVFIKVYDTGTCFLVKKKIFSSISVHGQPL